MMTPDELRGFALSLPEAVELETWGHPTFRARDKIFATLSADGDLAGVKCTKLDQTALVSFDPETFSVPACVGRHGWVSVRLASVDQEELRDLIVEAWRRSVPKRLAAAFEAERA